METITYQEIREEVRDIVKSAIEEAMGEARDTDELREKVSDRLHETIDGHEWVIYYSKAADVCYRLRQSDHAWHDCAQDDCRDIGGLEIGKDEDLDNVYCRLTYSILMTGAWNCYEEILEETIEADCKEWLEAGKQWAEGFKRHNSTREEAYEAEENGRQYSPFEFTAKEINNRPWSDSAWEAFQEGIDEVLATMPSEKDKTEEEC